MVTIKWFTTIGANILFTPVEFRVLLLEHTLCKKIKVSHYFDFFAVQTNINNVGLL